MKQRKKEIYFVKWQKPNGDDKTKHVLLEIYI